jgi:hypothetical protein
MQRRNGVTVAGFALALSAFWPMSTASAAAAPTTSPAALPECNSARWNHVGNHNVGGRIYSYRYVPVHAPGNLDCVRAAKPIQSSLSIGAIQNMLRRCYNQSIDLDWVFGPATTAALRNAQTWARVAENQPQVDTDGIYGPITRDGLRWPIYRDQTRIELAGEFICRRIG